MSISMLGGLLFCLGLCYRQGAGAWAQARSRTTMLQDFQVVAGLLTRGVENSCLESVSAEPDTLTFLSAQDQDGIFQFAADGSLLWQKYDVFLYDPSSAQLERFFIELTAGSPQITSPTVFDVYSPALAPSTYSVPRKPLARGLTTCQFSMVGDVVLWTATAERERHGRTDEEKLAFEWRGRALNQVE